VVEAKMGQQCLARGCDDERLEGSWFCERHQPLAKIHHHNLPPRRPPHPVHHEDSKPIEQSVEWTMVILFAWVSVLTLLVIGQALHLW
jgi:hypothetical protein